MIWAEMTTEELSEMPRSTILVRPIGATEQHGPHRPVNTVAFLAEHFGTRLEARRPRDLLVLPNVIVGASEHHMDFAGTPSVNHDTLFSYLTDILSSITRYGHRKILQLLNAQGGNKASLWPFKSMLVVVIPMSASY